MSKSEDIKRKLKNVLKEINDHIKELTDDGKLRHRYAVSSPPTAEQIENNIKELSSTFFTLNDQYEELLKEELQQSINDRVKISNKLKLTILYKLGIIEHLRTYDSLKNNDRALSRILNILLEAGTPDTFQTYLSSERSGDASSAKQNNPLSKKLVEEAEEMLDKNGLTISEIQKNYPL